VGEVKKSVNPIVYKSASVRNLPVPVQSVLQHCQSSMDPEDPPSETSAEKDYNRAVLELAQKKAECDGQLQELQQKAHILASRISGSTSGEGDGPSGNITKFLDGAGGNQTSEPVVPGSTNVTVDPRHWFFNDTSSGNNTHHDGRLADCPVCPEVPSPGDRGPCRECPPCGSNPDPSDGGGTCHSDSSPSGTSFFGLVDSPASFAVGAAAVLLVLALAVIIGMAVRYLPFILSGILVLSMACMVWYYSSRYPEAARRLGSRVWGALSGAAVYIVDRLLGRRNSEVSGKAVELDNSCRGVIV
jgi:uncharacterized membrane protein YphA (DoxX/SURF4 family)